MNESDKDLDEEEWWPVPSTFLRHAYVTRGSREYTTKIIALLPHL